LGIQEEEKALNEKAVKELESIRDGIKISGKRIYEKEVEEILERVCGADHNQKMAALNMSIRDAASNLTSIVNIEPYELTEDSKFHDGVPRGEIIAGGSYTSTQVYPGTARNYWLYVPKQYNPANPASLMVFLDGEGYMSPAINAAAVMDNLINKKEIPVMLGLFINAGDKGPGYPFLGGNDNRSIEYDSIDGNYASFLNDEILAKISQDYGITGDPQGRGICGMSSGGIGAFSAAWNRPDLFRKVISHCGSFINIRGGHNYPSMIRRNPNKPIRVFLQTGEHDVNTILGNIYIANLDMASALEYRDYEYQLVTGTGSHTQHQGASLLPDTMRWLWKKGASS
jgi:enterochelin esterase family protein